MIDHSLLRPELTATDVRSGCALAARYQVASVCVKPADVPLAAKELAGTTVLVGTVVGFPHGSSATRIKAAEARAALEDGADYVKTSTGFAPSGATLHDVRLMRAHVPAHIKIKAAAGVRSLDTLLEFHQAGADRFGASAFRLVRLRVFLMSRWRRRTAFRGWTESNSRETSSMSVLEYQTSRNRMAAYLPISVR